MNDGIFQWDDDKGAYNYAKHGVRFEAARGVFKDPFAIEEIDDRENYGEERFILIGMASGRLLTVVYTMRGEAIRIISARGAEPYEHRQYHEQNN
ncbi:MAG TPA: BrnT family toxin [Methylocystis sp.]|nr:BrnT family toxin [Methylocystis sp.]